MQTHDLAQGSDAWHQFRLDHFGASEAAAMLGLSKNVTRSELLRMKYTSLPKEFSDWVQEKILDHGHEVEALARPLVEALIGDDLFPVTCSDGRLSASCDGLTMDESTAFEHKQWNDALAASVRRGILPDEHQPQCQQIMRVTGASRVVFVVSNGTPDKFVSMEVRPDTEWFDRIDQGWAQFAADLDEYQPQEFIPAPVAADVEELPALLVEISGQVTRSNLDVFKRTVMARIAEISTDLTTDDDFVRADKIVKFLDDGEKRIELVKTQALEQTATIAELFRTLDHLKGEMKAKRLTLDKLVKARKETIRDDIVRSGIDRFAAHIAALNQSLGKPYLPPIKADFAGSVKNKRTIASLRDAVDTELARAKIEANGIADTIRANLQSLRELAADHAFLFADTASIVLKPNDDAVTLIKHRIAEHQAAEARRIEAERERIRKEEVARIEREQAAEAERIRVAGIREKIDAMKSISEMCAGQDAKIVSAVIKTTEAIDIDSTYAEFAREAQVAKDAALVELRGLFDAKQAAEAVPAPEPVAAPEIPCAEVVRISEPSNAQRGAPTLRLGEINSRLGFSVTADFLRALGFVSHAEGAAKLYHESDFLSICKAIVRHIEAVAAGQVREAA